MAQDEERAVAKRRREVAQLHPALGPPAQELDLVRRQVLGPHHRGGAVVLLEPVVDDQAARRGSPSVIGVRGYGVGCWMYGQST